MINIRYCKRCGAAFDIDTSKDLCPECRNVNIDERGLRKDGIKRNKG